MARVAILYICTGTYAAFWERFCRSFSEHFLPETEKDYYVFTDAPSIYGEDDPHIHRIPQENLGWPGNTLYRFRVFLKAEKELETYDYIFYLNANLVCMEDVTEEEFLPVNESLLVVQHPGNFDRRPYLYPYDRNRKSQAYIPYKCLEGKYYVCGGVNGGKKDAYLAMVRELATRVDADDAHGVIARWHDESHLNRYIIDHTDYRLLSPAYCYPEGWDIPFEQKFLVLDKKKYISLDTTKTSEIVPSRLRRKWDRTIQEHRERRLERYFAKHGL